MFGIPLKQHNETPKTIEITTPVVTVVEVPVEET